MSVGTVETILARCLVEPNFSQTLLQNGPKVLSSYDLDPKTIDEFNSTLLEKIRLFSGFISKIQHNFLWESFPTTRKLLSLYGIEVEIFAHYRSRQLALQRTKISREERINQFLNFLNSFLEVAEPGQYFALLEILRHERTMWKVRTAIQETSLKMKDINVGFEKFGWKEFLKLIPCFRGSFQIAQFKFDPEAIVKKVNNGTFQGKRPESCEKTLGYFGDFHSGQLKVLDLDTLSAIMLSQINGRRSVYCIVTRARRLGLEALLPRAFYPFFEDASNSGLLGFSLRRS